MRRTCVRRVCDSMANKSGSSFTTDLDVDTNYVLIKAPLTIDHSVIIDQRPPMTTVMNKTDLARCLTTSWTEHTWKKIVGECHRLLKDTWVSKG